jgi:hypothetical protein
VVARFGLQKTPGPPMYPIVSKFIDTNIQGKEMIGYQQLQPDGSKKLSMPSTNDPFNYLQ